MPDEEADDLVDPDAPPAKRRTTKRRSGAVGFAGALALGLQEVFEPAERDEIVQEIDESGEPDREAPVELLYIKDQPEDSKARVRRWLLER